MKKILAELEALLKSQAEQGFTGKINFLRDENSEILGHLFLHKSLITSFSYSNKLAKDAIADFVLMVAQGVSIKFIVEPEVYQDFQKNLYDCEIQNFLDLLLEVYKSMDSLAALIPPRKARFKLKQSIFEDGFEMSYQDFLTSMLVVNYGDLKKIMRNSPFADLSLFECLIFLRKKQALKVLA